MTINFVGNYQFGYVGEVSDETHLAREMADLGHFVRRIPRDEWREYVIEKFPESKYRGVPDDIKADINIIAKWHHFYSGDFIHALREKSGAPVFYWVWDYMYDQGIPDWHTKMAQASDLYLSNEGGVSYKYKEEGISHYYFPFDVCDGAVPRAGGNTFNYEVVFLGSYLGQGDRVEYLRKINKVHPIKIFSWNWQNWKDDGFDAEPAVYGEEFNRIVSKSKIVLGFNVNPNCWGYWSNRVGKVLRAGGFLLQQFAPGMELLIGDRADYFSSPEEAIEKISFYKENLAKRKEFLWNNARDEDAFTSKRRVAQLMTLCERYLKEDNGKKWNQLP